MLRDRASSIVECGLINRNQKVQIFHPASIRICKKILTGKKKKAVDLDNSAGIHKILWSWLSHSIQDFCCTLQLSLQLLSHMGRWIFVQHFPFHGEQNLLIIQTTLSKTIQRNSEFEVQLKFVGFTAHLIISSTVSAHFQFSSILWFRTDKSCLNVSKNCTGLFLFPVS